MFGYAIGVTESHAVVFHCGREVPLTDELEGPGEGDGRLHTGGDGGQEGGEAVGVGALGHQAGLRDLPQHAEMGCKISINTKKRNV